MIAAAVDATDLANVRLASKQLCDASTRLFGLARLRHRRFVVSQHSLQGLVDLTAHPILGCCVESLSIGTYRMKKHHINTEPCSNGSHANAAALKQFPFEQTGQHCVLLSKALMNLKQHGVVPFVGVFEDVICMGLGNDFYRQGYGYDELYGPISLQATASSRTTQTITALIEASNAVNCPVNRLAIDLQWTTFEPQAVSRHPGLDTQLRSLLINDSGAIKPGVDLVFKLTSGQTDYDIHTLELREADQSLSLFGISVEEFDGADAPQLDEQTYGSLARALYIERFEKLSLKSCEVDKTFIKLLRAHSNTLRHLDISCTTFFDYEEEEGIRFLTAIKDLPTLKLLRLHNLYFESVSGAVAMVNGPETWSGSNNVVAALDELISNVRATNLKMRRFGQG